jgi:hypothetical protein
MTRIYAKGRPTTGWQKGKRITRPEQVKPGDVLIGLSRQFKAENLYLVISSPHPPSPHDDQGFYVRYARPDLSPEFAEFQPQWVWGFMLAGENEWYKSERETYEQRTSR